MDITITLEDYDLKKAFSECVGRIQSKSALRVSKIVLMETSQNFEYDGAPTHFEFRFLVIVH
jgi:hypothetical protein